MRFDDNDITGVGTDTTTANVSIVVGGYDDVLVSSEIDNGVYDSDRDRDSDHDSLQCIEDNNY